MTSSARDDGIDKAAAAVADADTGRGKSKAQPNSTDNASSTAAPPPPKDAAALSKKEAKALKQQRRAAQVAARTPAPAPGGTDPSSQQQQQQQKGKRQLQQQQSSSSQPSQSQAGSSSASQRNQTNPSGATSATAPSHPDSTTTTTTTTTFTPTLPPSAAFSLLGHLPSASSCSIHSTGPSHRIGTPSSTITTLPVSLQPVHPHPNIHPSVATLCTLLSTHAVVGANARAIAVLGALRDFIRDYKTPADAVLQRDLLTRINLQIGALVEARPLGTSAGHAIRYLKHEISLTPVDMDEEEAKENLLSSIDHFIRDRILYAGRVIQQHASAKIRDGDIILTFARSSVVESVLHAAWDEGKRFEVIVMDSRPLLEGQRLLASLTARSIPCTYAYLTALPTLVPRTSLVLLGTAALLANGALYSRAGTASCAMSAHAHGIPVIVCAETYKFSDRVQLDGVVVNELGEPTALLSQNSSGFGPAALANLKVLAQGSGSGPASGGATAAGSSGAGAKKGGSSSIGTTTTASVPPSKAAIAAALAAISHPSQPTVPLSAPELASNPNLDANLSIASLLYDLTPPAYITAIASEVGLSGPEGVAIIVRDYKSITDQV
ncbi:hypothetical protein OC846_003732 [Tilletia horrida]|uniref:Translation initiation factor eIF2B subunit delta n=1 Tax=Tilletia horrida TaxID=155126 RepID=A0AAN6GRE5_9BASI|nr:hypothetical protein OC845_003578 [Tilletia horrida]KAK0550252.1 hypothetical protein OC846_003732 [Tilletia horrida]KAK0565398.1 hypothetical protein OC861_003768 [Tilletia horrida]